MPNLKCSLFAFMLLLLPQIFLGQELDKAFIKKNGIKSITEYSNKINNEEVTSRELVKYQIYDQNGNLIEKYEYNEHWAIAKTKYEYDSLGKLIKKVGYKPDGSEYVIDTWKYDNKGRVLKHITYYHSEKRYNNTDYYVYNKQGQNIEIYNLDKQGEKGRVITMKYYDSGELLEVRSEHIKSKSLKIEQYNKCGNWIFIPKNGREEFLKIWDSCMFFKEVILKSDTVQYIENEKEWTKITELRFRIQDIKIFDNSGNLIVNDIYHYNNDSTLNSREISYFNEQGQLIEAKEFLPGYSLAKDLRYHFKYEYYSNGLKKYVYSFNAKGEKKQYSEYEIEYY